MTNALQVLAAERDAMVGKLAALDSAIAILGGAPATRRGRGRPRGASNGAGYRRGSLKEFIMNALKGEAGPTDLASAVRSAGYKTKNKTLEKSVGIALAQLAADKHVRKVGRGRFVRA